VDRTGYRSGSRAAPMTAIQRRSHEREQEGKMPRKVRFALAVTVLALSAVSAVGTASAFPFSWRAVPFYYIPL
jgi:hypothetical protein